jgi:hypothetical protein
MDGSRGPFQALYRGVVVKRHYEFAAKFPGEIQISDVSRMQEIKTSVGKNQALSFLRTKLTS